MKYKITPLFGRMLSAIFIVAFFCIASPALASNFNGDFSSPTGGAQTIGGNQSATQPGSSGTGGQSLQGSTPPTVEAVTLHMDRTMKPLWDVGATSKAGAQGLGFMVLSSLFGIDVFTEIIGTDTVNVNGKNILIEGPTQGITIAMMSFAAQLAFLILPILIGLLATTGLVNSLQFGEWFGSDQPSYYLAIRFLGGMVLAIPNPFFFGMSVIQQVIILLALYSNGIGNYAAEMLVTASYESPNGAKHVALAIGAIPPSPRANIDDVANEVFFAQAVQQSCVANARKLGIGGREQGEVCRAISGSIGNPTAGGLDGTAGDASNSANNVNVGSSCAGFEPVEGAFNKATSRETSWKYGTCVVFTDAVNQVQPKLHAAMELEDGEEKDAALLEVATEFKDLLGIIDKTTDRVIAERASGVTGLFNECASMPPDIRAECLARPSNEQFDFAAQVDPLSTNRFIIQSAGWPGMGMIYYTVASQIEAMNTTARTVGADTKLSLGDLRAANRIGATLRSRTQTDSARAEFASSLVDQSSAANIPEIADIGLSSAFTKYLSSLFGIIGEGVAGTAETLATGANLKVSEFFSDFFISRSAPEALYNYSSTWIGVVATVMVAHDVIDKLPAGTALKKAMGVASDFAMGKKDRKGNNQGNFTQQGLSFAMQFIFTFTTIIAFINVAVLPKLPAVFVAVMTIDWAVNLLVIAFASPLWMLFNLSAAPAGKMLFTHSVLKGIQTLAWLLLYPTLIVFGVAISMIIFNVAVPLVVIIVASTYHDGIIGNVVNMLMAPFLFMFLSTVMGFAAISLILRLPYQFAGFLGLSPMEGEMIKTASRFLGGESQLGQAQEQMSMPGINQAVANQPIK